MNGAMQGREFGDGDVGDSEYMFKGSCYGEAEGLLGFGETQLGHN